MGFRILLAGAAGAIGSRLVPLLLEAGHTVVGTTRSSAKADKLRGRGVEPVVVDVFDADALKKAVVSARPEIVIHQLTDLPSGIEPGRMAEAIVGNARVRDEGTRNLVLATLAAGSRRLIGQSIAWAYATGPQPYREDAPLDGQAEGNRAITVNGVIALERQILGSQPLEGVLLRYGRLYGPGPASTRLPLRCRSMSMRPPMQPCWPSRASHREYSTLPSPTTRLPRKRPSPSWVGMPVSAFQSSRLPNDVHGKYLIRLA